MLKHKEAFLALLLFVFCVQAKESFIEPMEKPPTPWLTGPLIAPIGDVIPLGHFEIQAETYFTTFTGSYDANGNFRSADSFFSMNPQLYLYVGLTPWLDFNIVPQFFYNHTKDQNSVVFGDLFLALDLQVLDPDAISYFPGIKVTFGETFPTGPYQNLNPSKLLTDQAGLGSFQTTFELVLYKVYYLTRAHFLSTTYTLSWTWNTPVDVHGLNVYGGGEGTNGTVQPGNNITGMASFELTLTQNFVLALDTIFSYTSQAPFFGIPGRAPIGLLPATEFSLAPAMEYNFSETLGIELGCWFTVYGQSTPAFRSAVFNLTYTY